MSPLFYILSVALGGAGGALFREFLSRELNGRTKFPAGTFTANMLASFFDWSGSGASKLRDSPRIRISACRYRFLRNAFNIFGARLGNC